MPVEAYFLTVFETVASIAVLVHRFLGTLSGGGTSEFNHRNGLHKVGGPAHR